MKEVVAVNGIFFKYIFLFRVIFFGRKLVEWKSNDPNEAMHCITLFQPGEKGDITKIRQTQ